MINKIAGDKWTGKNKEGELRSFAVLEENHETSVIELDIAGDIV
jgi:hypothetical protein